jgi:hypothetical protein
MRNLAALLAVYVVETSALRTAIRLLVRLPQNVESDRGGRCELGRIMAAKEGLH